MLSIRNEYCVDRYGKQSCIRRCIKKKEEEKEEEEKKRRKTKRRKKEEQDEEQPPTPGKFENGVHRVTFPLFGREESDVWLRADARIWCPSSRRIERKEALKKLVLSFPSWVRGPAAPGSPVRVLLYKPRRPSIGS